MTSNQTLIIGANSDIAKAIALQLINISNHRLIVISRDLSAYANFDTERITGIEIENYHPDNIEHAITKIPCSQQQPITQVFICHGLLHKNNIQPEKRIEDFDVTCFQTIMEANAITPMLWIQKLIPLLPRKHPCKLIVFSARVGSISDNHLGGWYSYRASKAALNMMLKNTAIELARRAKNIKVISFHPGTTDTPLSKPFQKNVPADKLFSSEFVANQLLTIVDSCAFDNSLSYLDWQGKTIPW
ncbi:SDR family NAD(P)-dependent oxidoreductase [Colwelliaceae bacterium 6471]